jgi:hypothetical protein
VEARGTGWTGIDRTIQCEWMHTICKHRAVYKLRTAAAAKTRSAASGH